MGGNRRGAPRQGPNQACTVHFFSNRGNPEGRKICIERKGIITGADGNDSFTFSTRGVSAGKTVTSVAAYAQDNPSKVSVSRLQTKYVAPCGHTPQCYSPPPSLHLHISRAIKYICLYLRNRGGFFGGMRSQENQSPTVCNLPATALLFANDA